MSQNPKNLAETSAEVMEKISNSSHGRVSPDATELESVNNEKSFDIAAYAKTTNTNFDIDEIKQEMESAPVLQTFRDATNILKDPNTPLEQDAGVNWDEIYSFSTNLLRNYSTQIDQIFVDLDTSLKEQVVWQEAAFAVDAHRGSSRVSAAEKWMEMKLSHINSENAQVQDSAEIIKKTLGRLGKVKK